ncbi:MAG: hypothetical protein KatS3mg087_1109 [Patescibacteria group bacterium]|nr:MAG: hypothetical protein KatS3mg087_1109 [Patescibacteria group bacterium]
MKKKHHPKRSVMKKRATRKPKMEVPQNMPMPNVPQPFMTGGKGSPIGHVPDIAHVLRTTRKM